MRIEETMLHDTHGATRSTYLRKKRRQPMSNAKVTEKLNGLLASSAVFYQKLRNYHWNVKGDDFFELHAIFEDLYTRWAEHVDIIAERILMLGERPYSTLAELLEHASIKEDVEVKASRDMVASLVSDFGLLQKQILGIIDDAENQADRKTANVLDDLNDEIEKDAWMFNAWLAK
ncbi:MAG TPA: DNA starvation/stationary phase protection protein [Myxococcales bacterium]|nr:DNA starvation/stationary phase protection protein [Deltaproteobacteria bacterium]HAA58769.1 DNA starvation/stationary phase protection protein [Myxococcales bacterium]